MSKSSQVKSLQLFAICVLSIVLLLGCAKEGTKAYQWDLPEGFPLPQVPEDNPMTQAKVELGRALFYEPALSGNRAMACGTCHEPSKAFSDGKVRSSGSTGDTLTRNSLALVNIAYNSEFTWAHNGLSSIEQQMMIPLFNEQPVEMGISNNLPSVLKRFDTKDYRTLFKKAFGEEEPNIDKIVKAIASFVRSLTSFSSPFDDYAYRGKDNAINESQLRGLELFFSERFECFHCHGGFNFTQSSKHEFQPLDLQPFHNTGLYNEDGKGAFPERDRGLIDVTHQAQDMGRFRAPTLRNIELSAPYMHDGSIQTLDEVIDFYAAGGRGSGIKNPLKSQFVIGFRMNEQEKQDLLAFLLSLSDPSFGQKSDHHAPVNPPKVN